MKRYWMLTMFLIVAAALLAAPATGLAQDDTIKIAMFDPCPAPSSTWATPRCGV